MQPQHYEEPLQDVEFSRQGCGLHDIQCGCHHDDQLVALVHEELDALINEELGAPPVQVFKAYDMSGKFLAGPISVIDFFGSQLGGQFTNAACACTNHALPLHCE